jgi:hypothetical protein
MEDSKKKLVSVVIIVVCLVTAAVITYFTRPIRDFPIKGDVWLLCRNCQAAWQMGKKDYFKYLAEHQDPATMLPPGVLCAACGKETGFRAEKCEKCGLIFERSSVAHDFADRCPSCGYSSTEARRKESRKGLKESTDG